MLCVRVRIMYNFDKRHSSFPAKSARLVEVVRIQTTVVSQLWVPCKRNDHIQAWWLRSHETSSSDATVVLFVCHVKLETSPSRVAGSDPEVVCQKNSLLKVSVSLSGFGPSVTHGKLSVRGRCVQATKNKAETCSLLVAIGRRSCRRSGLGIKIGVWENPVVHASTRDWSNLYGKMRSGSETAAQSSCSHFECHWEHSGCLSSACIVVCAVNFPMLWRQWRIFVSPLSLWVLSLGVSIEKNKERQYHRTTVSSSKRTFANSSKLLL